MSTYIALLICIFPGNKHATETLATVAHARGYDVIVGDTSSCAVRAMPGSEDATGVQIWTYDARRAMTWRRANNLITAWEARF